MTSNTTKSIIRIHITGITSAVRILTTFWIFRIHSKLATLPYETVIKTYSWGTNFHWERKYFREQNIQWTHSSAVFWDGILWILSNTFCNVSSYGFKFQKEKTERIFPVILACVRKNGKFSYEHKKKSFKEKRHKNTNYILCYPKHSVSTLESCYHRFMGDNSELLRMISV